MAGDQLPAATAVTENPSFIGGCSSSMTTGQIVSISGLDGMSATQVTDGFETKELEAQGWRKLHQNVLIGGR